MRAIFNTSTENMLISKWAKTVKKNKSQNNIQKTFIPDKKLDITMNVKFMRHQKLATFP